MCPLQSYGQIWQYTSIDNIAFFPMCVSVGVDECGSSHDCSTCTRNTPTHYYAPGTNQPTNLKLQCSSRCPEPSTFCCYGLIFLRRFSELIEVNFLDISLQIKSRTSVKFASPSWKIYKRKLTASGNFRLSIASDFLDTSLQSDKEL